MDGQSTENTKFKEEISILNQKIHDLKASEPKRKQVEAELQLFRNLVENSSDAIGISTPEGKHYYQNEAFSKLFGTIGDWPAETLYVNKAIGKMVFDTIVNGGSWQGEVKMFNKDGQIMDIFQKAYPVHSLDGYIIGVVGLYTNNTEHKRAREALNHRESYISAIIENQPGLVWLKDRQSRFLTVNQSFALSCGKQTSEELVGKTDQDIWPAALAEKYRRDDMMIMETGKPVIVEEPIYDGSNLRWFETFKTPVFDGQGNIIGTTGYARDISARKEAEEYLKQSEKKFATAFLKNSIPATITTVKEGRYMEVSETFLKLMGMERSEVIGHTSTEIGFITPEQRKKLLDELNRKGSVENLELQMRIKGGELRCGLFNSATISISNEVHLLTVVMDITERKQAEVELAKYKKELEQLVEARTKDLENKTQALEELNIALKVLLQHREEDKIDLEERVATNVSNLIIPFMEKIKSSRLDERQLAYLSIIETHINDITSSMMKKMRQFNFTPTEIEVASLIKEGKASKEIAKIIGIATSSVNTHRNNIRKKLGIIKENVNLQIHLQSID
ncbi:MAG: hypothetical protein CSYNP_00515 [Syntrophus sp. SKADARSKE-3]|nr:hypothetical protein [Syntrophus sp. SKADARSKE-3]